MKRPANTRAYPSTADQVYGLMSSTVDRSIRAGVRFGAARQSQYVHGDFARDAPSGPGMSSHSSLYS
jgi:hypothetical protein